MVGRSRGTKVPNAGVVLVSPLGRRKAMKASDLRKLLLVAAMATVIVVDVPGPALASCVEPPPLSDAIAEADIVFVGLAVALDFEGRLATFEIIEVWKGELGPSVVVNGGPELRAMGDARARGQTLASSVDRMYVLGETYLVVSFGRSGDVVMDNACSSTQVMNSDLTDNRPENAYSPQQAPIQDDPTDAAIGWIVPAVIALAAIAAAGFAIYARPPEPRHLVTRNSRGAAATPNRV